MSINGLVYKKNPYDSSICNGLVYKKKKVLFISKNPTTVLYVMFLYIRKKNKLADQVPWHFSNGYIFIFNVEPLETVACLDYDGYHGNYENWIAGFDWFRRFWL